MFHRLVLVIVPRVLKIPFKWAAVAAACNLIALSHLSGFRFDHVASLNWDIILMLTPLGIVHFLGVQSNHYLKPYYFEPNLMESSSQLTLFLLGLQIVLSGVTLLLFLKSQLR